MKNVMVDLETLGLTAGCAILSIGAVGFDVEAGVDIDSALYLVPSLKSNSAAGLYIDPETEKWWAEQTDGARQVLALAKQTTYTLAEALAGFNAWLAVQDADVCVWGNGSEFDNAVLTYAYRAAKVPRGWHYKNSRCYRTLKELRPNILPVDYGVAHNAKDDAIAQAEHAVRLLRTL